MFIINTYMKSYFKSFKKNAGFTLIELLVVIGILGVLAAALIATIDPFEQLKKAQDANVKNTTVEFVNANIRYYTTHNALPWADINGGAAYTACRTTPTPSGVVLTGTQMSSCLASLISDGELKAGFTTVVSILGEIYATGTSNTVVACFAPQSKSQKKDLNTKYTISGALVPNPTTACIGYDGSTVCYWCAQ